MVAALLALAALFAPGSALADFTASTTSGFAPLTVRFIDGSGAATTSWQWDFGDGQTSNLQSPPPHVYSNPGTYTVKLTTSDGATTSDATPVTITVTQAPPPPPTARFSSAGNPAAGAHAVTFTDMSTGPPTSWKWDFGDKTTSLEQNPIHAYIRPGTYNVRLTACNAGGCNTTATPGVKVTTPNNPPQLLQPFLVIPNPAAVNDTIALDASGAASDADLDPISYEWSIDGAAFKAGPAVTYVTFTTVQTHFVTLRVSDGFASAVSVSTAVSVRDDKSPQPGFSFTPTSPTIGQSVVFTSSSTDPDGQVKRLDWDLDGDGQFDDAAGSVAQWTYFTPGMRVVALKVTDDKDVSAIAAQTVTVIGPLSSTPAGSPPAPASSSGVPRTKRVLLSPFPIIRMRARIIGSIIHIDLLSVKAPSGATVQVRCKGRRCPVSRERERVRKGARSVRFHKLERRLRAGTGPRDLRDQGRGDRQVHALCVPRREGPLAPRPLPPLRIDAPRAVSRAMNGRLPMAGAAFGVCAGLVVAASLHRGAEAPTAAAPLAPLSARSQPAAPTGLPRTATTQRTVAKSPTRKQTRPKAKPKHHTQRRRSHRKRAAARRVRVAAPKRRVASPAPAAAPTPAPTPAVSRPAPKPATPAPRPRPTPARTRPAPDPAPRKPAPRPDPAPTITYDDSG